MPWVTRYGGDFVEHVFGNPAGKYFGISPRRECWHGACSVVPTRTGEHQHWAYREEHPNTGAEHREGIRPGCPRIRGGAGIRYEDIIGSRAVGREFGLDHLAFVSVFAP